MYVLPRGTVVVATVAGCLLACAGSAQGAVPLTQVFSDPFYEHDEPAQDGRRAGHLRLRLDARHRYAERPLLRRR